MRILFFTMHPGYFRHYGPLFEAIVRQGHELEILLDNARYDSDELHALCQRHENANWRRASAPAPGRYLALADHLGTTSDYFRYLEPAYRHATKLRARASRRVPVHLHPLVVQRPRLQNPGERARIDGAIRAIEGQIPRGRAGIRFLANHAPDVVVVGPLFGSRYQLEYMRSARALGIPTVLAVASWDNLTNKGLIREMPDRVVVWNLAQRDEAVRWHGVDPKRVVVTGAPHFDKWFEMRPTRSAVAFARLVGLREDRPYFLYLGSSGFIAREEAAFFLGWLSELRSARPELRDIQVLVRPHPQNARQWQEARVHDIPGVSIFPDPTEAPEITGNADYSNQDYYESMYYAAAAIGVNTTAMIESAIVGRGVYSLLTARFRETQQGTIHFDLLRDFAGGLLHLSESIGEQADQLVAALAGEGDDRSRRFIEAFARPNGFDVPATPLAVDAILGAAELRPSRSGARSSPLARLGVEILAYYSAFEERDRRKRHHKAHKKRRDRRAQRSNDRRDQFRRQLAVALSDEPTESRVPVMPDVDDAELIARFERQVERERDRQERAMLPKAERDRIKQERAAAKAKRRSAKVAEPKL